MLWSQCAQVYFASEAKYTLSTCGWLHCESLSVIRESRCSQPHRAERLQQPGSWLHIWVSEMRLVFWSWRLCHTFCQAIDKDRCLSSSPTACKLFSLAFFSLFCRSSPWHRDLHCWRTRTDMLRFPCVFICFCFSWSTFTSLSAQNRRQCCSNLHPRTSRLHTFCCYWDAWWCRDFIKETGLKTAVCTVLDCKVFEDMQSVM